MFCLLLRFVLAMTRRGGLLWRFLFRCRSILHYLPDFYKHQPLSSCRRSFLFCLSLVSRALFVQSDLTSWMSLVEQLGGLAYLEFGCAMTSPTTIVRVSFLVPLFQYTADSRLVAGIYDIDVGFLSPPPFFPLLLSSSLRLPKHFYWNECLQTGVVQVSNLLCCI